DAEPRERADGRLLEPAAVPLHVLLVPVQVEDRIADELARPVVGRAAAAVGLDDRDLRAFRHVQLRRVGAPAERDRRRVLEEEHRVRDRALRDGRGERALQVPRLDVVHAPEVHDVGVHAPDCSQPTLNAALTGSGYGGPVIEARGLTKDYGPKRAVDDLTFGVQPGLVTGFLGPN